MTTLAADFGGRRIKLGLVREGQVLGLRVIPAEADQPLSERLKAVAAEFKELCRTHNCSESGCTGITLAYPSIIDVQHARILDHFGKFGDASKLDLKGWARAEFNLPLAIDNDARMALAGEWRYGAGTGCDNLVMMTLGTGLGASAIIEGHLLRGTHGQAGILGGHLTLRYDGGPCVCGNVGCSESEASTWRLEEIAKSHHAFQRSGLTKEPVIDYAAVFRLAAENDPCALALRDHALRVWSATAVSLIHAYDPEKLILGGGIMGSHEVIVPAVQDWLNRHAHTPWGKVQVLRSKLGDHAALVAGEWLIQEQMQLCCEEK